MYSIRYALGKYLKENCNMDIHSSDFNLSKQMFKAKVTDLKKCGQGSTDHKSVITPSDMEMLNSLDCVGMSVSTPAGFQRRVWFNIMYYFCRRGRENLRSMTKETFSVKKDAEGSEYLTQCIDEVDKNHGSEAKPDETIGEGRVYARENDPNCPVAAFKKYLSKLSPDIDALWQRPLESFLDADETYYKAPLGKNTLGSMMSTISRSCGLSQKYTNHCIRATAITNLDRAGIEARHIMRLSGHNSEASIRSYACRLSEGKQREMFDCLSKAAESVTAEPPVTPEDAPENVNALNAPENVSALNDISLEELAQIFSEENEFHEINLPNPSTSTSSLNKENAAPVVKPPLMAHDSNGNPICNLQPIFHNCTVHFNINQGNELCSFDMIKH